MAEQAPIHSGTSDAIPAESGRSAESLGSDTRPVDGDTRSTRATPTTGREAMRRSARGTHRPNDSAGDAVREVAAKVQPDAPVTDPDAPAAPKWETPAYAKAWNEQRRKMLEGLATNEATKEHYKEIDGLMQEMHRWDSDRNYQLGNYRKSFDGIAPMVEQMRQVYTRQGMSLEQGIGQMWQTAQDLASDPDSTIARLGNWYKPRNAGQVLNHLAQAWGQNLGELAQGQPYVDPVVQQQIRQQNDLIQRMSHQMTAQQQQQRQAQVNALVQACTEFENAKDASGNLKHPYAGELGNDIAMLLQTGRARNIPEAYEMAAKYHPKAVEERAKRAEKEAREKAERTTAEAEHARNSARNINGKAAGRVDRVLSMDDAIAKANRQTFGQR